MFSDVHAQSSGSTAESVSLGSVLASVTNLTKELVLVSVGIGRVQHLVAQAAFEALLVPFHATGYALFGGVHGLGALGALGDIDGDERHLETLNDRCKLVRESKNVERERDESVLC